VEPQDKCLVTATHLEDTLSAAVQIACEAGRIILPFFQQSGRYQLKADRSPVTEADLASHAFLVKSLGRLTPELTVVSEESAHPEITTSLPNDYWLIDPLDGTKEFLKGKPEFTVNIALINGRNPILGVVYAPASGLTYSAQNGRGAWRKEGQNPALPIRTRPANMNRLTVVASKDHNGPGVRRLLERLSPPEITSIGSSLKFCLVAEGSADLYFRDGPTMEWDTAAAQCVLEAAGGSVLGLSGEVLHYGKATMKNGAFVAVGDPAFPWTELKQETDNKKVFEDFFAEINREVEDGLSSERSNKP
jgi:3'(2'), 5'-bisphosphate nucleotidase